MQATHTERRTFTLTRTAALSFSRIGKYTATFTADVVTDEEFQTDCLENIVWTSKFPKELCGLGDVFDGCANRTNPGKPREIGHSEAGLIIDGAPQGNAITLTDNGAA